MDKLRALTLSEAEPRLKTLCSKWHISNNGYLCKDFIFNDFMDAMHFANRVADISENFNHHPKLTISWGRCLLEIWTHDLEGVTGFSDAGADSNQKLFLTVKDFDLAQRIDDHYRD